MDPAAAEHLSAGRLPIERSATMTIDQPANPVAGSSPSLGPLRRVRTQTLEIRYFAVGPADGDVILLLHRFPRACDLIHLVWLGRVVNSGGQGVIPFPVEIGPGQGAVGCEGVHVLVGDLDPILTPVG